MSTGRLVFLAALGYGALCLIFFGLAALLGALFIALNATFSVAQSLLICGLASLVPAAAVLLFGFTKTEAASRGAPAKYELESAIAELGAVLGREAGEFVSAKPWQTMLAAGIAGFLASANPKLISQLLKGLKLQS